MGLPHALRWLPGVVLIAVVACAPAAQPSPTAAPAKPADKAAEKPAAKPTEKPAAKAETKTEAKPAAKAETKTEAKPGQKLTLSNFIQRMEEQTKGVITIDYRGGPEVVPQAEQLRSLQNGVFDLWYGAGAFGSQLVPEGPMLDYMDGTAKELRDAGVYELYDKIFQQKANARFLGLGTTNVGFALYTKNPVNTLEDFRGMKMRTLPNYLPFQEALGASTVSIPTTEVYSALERGVVDGYGWPRIDYLGVKLFEVSCCTVDPGFWSLHEFYLVNARKWDGLSEDQKKMINDVIRSHEEWMESHFPKRSNEEMAQARAQGLQVIKLPEAEARRYREIAYSSPWEKYLPTLPEYGQQLKQLADKVNKVWPPRDYQVLEKY